MEPIFKREPYKQLVPEISIKANKREVNLLDAGHRAADAIIRFSDLADELAKGFVAVGQGDSTQLAKFAPTSLVFGAWDSRGTQVKLPRIVRSVIRAFKVRPLHRSAQYIPAIEYVDEGLLDAPAGEQQKESMSQLGLTHAPAPWTHGGVLVEEIRRDATLNLVALRSLAGGTERNTLLLRRYILGLALCAITAPQECFLREGCQLVEDIKRPPQWFLVRHDGRREDFSVSSETALDYATQAARDFGVGQDRKGTFKAETAKEAIAQSKQERKKARHAKDKETQEGIDK